MRIRDIEAKIEEKLTFDRAKLPRVVAVVWAPRASQFEATMLYASAAEGKPGDDARRDAMAATQPMTLRVGGEWPYRRDMTIVAIFSDDDVHRVYAVTTAQNLDGAQGVPPTRYSCKRGTVDYFAEVMHIDTFIDEIVNEWVGVEAGVTSAEAEQDAVTEYLHSLPDDYSVKQAAVDIEQGVHHDGEDEDEAPERGPVPAAVVEPPKPEATPS